MSDRPTPLILGLPGPTLDAETFEMIRGLRPAGYILFKRNCENPTQLRALVRQLTSLSPYNPPLIFIDQEGGRVNRIGWAEHKAPPPAVFGRIYEEDPATGVEAARLNAFLLAAELADYGITVDCLPLADVARSETHTVIGDRAFSNDPAAVSALCGATISGLIAGGVWPVIKHAPGHGRAMADSHHELPTVEASAAELETDFKPFRANARCPFVMTAHVLYEAFDKECCATQSRMMVQRILRGKLGMSGIIVSDDICMEALVGTPFDRATAALEAGCGLILHCNGKLEEMVNLVGLPPVSADTEARLQILPALGHPNAATIADARKRLAGLLPK